MLGSPLALEAVCRSGTDLMIRSKNGFPKNGEIVVKDNEGQPVTLSLRAGRRDADGSWIQFAQGPSYLCLPDPESLLAAVRREPRYGLHFLVRLAGDSEFYGISQDLSLGGLQVVSNRPLRLGARELIELEFSPEEILRFPVHVRWCQVTAPYLAGLQFGELSPSQNRQLEQILRDGISPRFSYADKKVAVPEEFLTSVPLNARVTDCYLIGDQLTLEVRDEHEMLRFRFRGVTLHTRELQDTHLRRHDLLRRPGNFDSHLFLNSCGQIALDLECRAFEILTAEQAPPESKPAQNCRQESILLQLADWLDRGEIRLVRHAVGNIPVRQIFPADSSRELLECFVEGVWNGDYPMAGRALSKLVCICHRSIPLSIRAHLIKICSELYDERPSRCAEPLRMISEYIGERRRLEAL